MTERFVWRSGENATLRGVGSKVFWAIPTIVVQDSPDLIALYLPAGALGRNTEHRPTPQELLAPEKLNIINYQWNRTDVLMLILPGESFSTYVMWEAGTRNMDCWYINLQEPIRRTSIGFDTMDLMLDVVVSPDLSEWQWKDEDELAEAEKIGFYSPEKTREIWSEGEKAIKLLTSDRRTLYEEWRAWQARPEWKIPKLSPLWDRINLDGADLIDNK